MECSVLSGSLANDSRKSQWYITYSLASAQCYSLRLTLSDRGIPDLGVTGMAGSVNEHQGVGKEVSKKNQVSGSPRLRVLEPYT